MRARPTTGERGRRFTLEQPVEVADGFGGVLRSFVPGPQLWGAIELVTGDERFAADRAESRATHRVTFAWRDGVTASARLTLGSRRFRIRHAGDPDGRRQSLVCLVEEITP